MATIVLAAAGAAAGSAIGGTVAGLSAAVIGRAVGATIGRAIDARLMGGSTAVETGKIDQFRLSNATEGGPIPQVYGRMRVGGQVIWATQFLEASSTTNYGGKGGSSSTATSYSYSVSIAVAICTGQITRVTRVWADGEELDLSTVSMVTYTGSDDQLPDPLMEAVEGAGAVPAYRGTAYAVFEDLALEPFGNRVPSFSFEVIRAEQPDSSSYDTDLAQIVTGVALIPGTGEYSLATTPVYLDQGAGVMVAANQSTASGLSDLETSLEALTSELPSANAVSLVVSWFGDDLRCAQCTIRPKVEQAQADGTLAWQVSGVDRQGALVVPNVEGAPVYGGTPTDQAVIEAIVAIKAGGQRVMFYPFILMEQLADNTLPDPWTGNEGQPALPWRGRITTSLAPGIVGSPDGTAQADTEAAAFLGTVTAADFTIEDGAVRYDGPEEWSLSRFILHYAALCAAAGGVEAFCVGSELRALTQIRGANGFPVVEGLRALTAQVRLLLGEDTKLGYAADWSEYWGYNSPEGDRYFHLDPLWGDDAIDFIGIDNYMPLSDWRDTDWRTGETHLDAAEANAIYELPYLMGNIEGGEGYDWFYHSDTARAAQIRTPITDGAYNEPWIWRYKDLRGWWSNDHYERIDGIRQSTPTPWEAKSKPIWFTELGCAAIDKGTNQPNKFLDPKSSESTLPHYSTGARDDLIQQQYLRAQMLYWDDDTNPLSDQYDGRMLDMDNAYVWAWDARPYPAFPNRSDLWSDGDNYLRGHWLNGRVGQRTLASVVEEICTDAGLAEIDVSDLWGIVRGYNVQDIDAARAALQPLMLQHGFDAIERAGQLIFLKRDGLGAVALSQDELVEHADLSGTVEKLRDPEAELTGRVRLRYVQAGGDHTVTSQEAVLPDEATHAVSQNELPLALTDTEARQSVQRWLAEARIGRDHVSFALPPSKMGIGAGDIVSLEDESGVSIYRVDNQEQGDSQLIEAQRIEPEAYVPAVLAEDLPGTSGFVAPVPVLPLFLDLPLMTGDEVPHAPHLAVTGGTWPGSVALYSADLGGDYVLDDLIVTRATVGVTATDLAAAPIGRWDRGSDLVVDLIAGTLESRTELAVLSGANRLAIGDGTSGTWEVLQFEEAELIGTGGTSGATSAGRYLLRGRLRGQYGTPVPDVWPAGSYVVLLDSRVAQIELAASLRRVARDYRIGPALRSHEDASYVTRQEAFDGVGLRPFAPVHLSSSGALGTELDLTWIRRTRVDGDSWDSEEVPLGEDSEAYRVQVVSGAQVLRSETVNSPTWTYNAAAQAADGVRVGDHITVAQISARYGAGRVARLILT